MSSSSRRLARTPNPRDTRSVPSNLELDEDESTSLGICAAFYIITVGVGLPEPDAGFSQRGGNKGMASRTHRQNSARASRLGPSQTRAYLRKACDEDATRRRSYSQEQSSSRR
ncbi:hypothetical protein F5B22DRAFT_650914 [Xylaria bambusicola]|uniref:uncharacterized protein n=1 Tax=Xylaria bambusicola TaxID=326684 RepID=UPI0020087631|nr:uncharacterized protein F5B22DRAFT_650914 [Xylaria bambusicola]KAI0506207.1 hypothetical protein F5B22DRAFT_650914 [Xylaria bambusicola]